MNSINLLATAWENYLQVSVRSRNRRGDGIVITYVLASTNAAGKIMYIDHGGAAG